MLSLANISGVAGPAIRQNSNLIPTSVLIREGHCNVCSIPKSIMCKRSFLRNASTMASFAHMKLNSIVRSFQQDDTEYSDFASYIDNSERQDEMADGSSSGIQILAGGASTSAPPGVGFSFNAFGYEIILPEYTPGLFKKSGASGDVYLKLGINGDKALGRTSIVQRYGNLIGFVCPTTAAAGAAAATGHHHRIFF
ncbi:hypothetical protein Tco_0943800 [Tanacetum coccineum]